MSLIALVAALLIEQWRPLADRRYLYAQGERYAKFLETQFNAEEAEHGTVAWLRQHQAIVARDNSLVLSFFRSQGMMAAPFIPLEKDPI